MTTSFLFEPKYLVYLKYYHDKPKYHFFVINNQSKEILIVLKVNNSINKLKI